MEHKTTSYLLMNIVWSLLELCFGSAVLHRSIWWCDKYKPLLFWQQLKINVQKFGNADTNNGCISYQIRWNSYNYITWLGCLEIDPSFVNLVSEQQMWRYAMQCWFMIYYRHCCFPFYACKHFTWGLFVATSSFSDTFNRICTVPSCPCKHHRIFCHSFHVKQYVWILENN